MKTVDLSFDLEKESWPSLFGLLERELEKDFPKKAVNKGLRLLDAAKWQVELVGEEVTGWCDDGRKVSKFRLTLPLYDLEEGYSFATCSCQDLGQALDVERCEHLFGAQRALYVYLEEALSSNEQEGGWQEAFASLAEPPEAAQPPASSCAPARLLWEVSNELEPQPRLQNYKNGAFTRGRILSKKEFAEGGQAWPDQHAKLCRAHLGPDGTWDIFALWQELRGCKNVVLESSSRPVEVLSGQLGLSLEKAQEGYRVLITVGGDTGVKKRLFEGGQIVLKSLCGEKIFLCEPPLRYEKLVKRFFAGTEKIPSQDKKTLFQYLSQIEGELSLDYNAVIQEEGGLAAGPLVLQLAPHHPEGLMVQVMVRPTRGRAFTAGLGPAFALDLTDPEKPKKMRRDLEEERVESEALIGQLKLHDYMRHPEQPTFYLQEEEVLFFIRRLDRFRSQSEMGQKVLVEWPENLACPKVKQEEIDEQEVKISFGGHTDWFDLRIKLGDEEVLLEKILAMLKDKRHFVAVKGDLYAKVSRAMQKKLEAMVERFGLAKDKPPAIEACYPEIVKEKERGHILVEKAPPSFVAVESAGRLVALMPKGIKATLRPYQKDGVSFLMRASHYSPGALLADDMGLGKTLQAITFMLSKCEMGPSIVVCPTSVVFNWQEEIKKFAPDLRPIAFEDWQKEQRVLVAKDILLVSFGRCLTHQELLIKQKWNILTVDEAQVVKNHKSKTFSSLTRLKRQFCLLLSGTPVENNLSELWSLFSLAVPGVLGSYQHFRENFMQPIEKDGCKETLKLLGRIIHPLLLRRLKADCLDELPSKTEKNLWIDLTIEERQVYDALRLEALDKLSQKDEQGAKEGEKRFEVLAALSRLRMCCCHVSMVDPDWEGTATKLIELLRLLEGLREGGHKVLVFSQFVRHLELIKAACESRGFTPRRLSGETSSQKRKELVRDFQKGEFDIFLISLKAGGTGLNLTEADYVIHVDPWWNPAAEDQATDRAHRMGQKRPVTIYRLVARGTVEEKIMALHESKRKLAFDILQSAASEGAASGMRQPSSEELFSLL